MIFRSDNFYEMFLKWKNYGNMDFKYCFSLNFDYYYYDNQLYIQQISMNLDSTMENIPNRCFMVFVGGKHLLQTMLQMMLVLKIGLKLCLLLMTERIFMLIMVLID